MWGNCGDSNFPGTCQMTQKPGLPTPLTVLAVLGDQLTLYWAVQLGQLCQAQ